MMKNILLLPALILLCCLPDQITAEDNSLALACSNATNINCSTDIWVNPSTANHLNAMNYDLTGCFAASHSYNGTEHFYRLSVGATPTDVTVSITGLSNDVDMMLFRTCTTVAGNAVLSNCVAYSANGNLAPETLTVSGASGDYYLVIDGREW